MNWRENRGLAYHYIFIRMVVVWCYDYCNPLLGPLSTSHQARLQAGFIFDFLEVSLAFREIIARKPAPRCEKTSGQLRAARMFDSVLLRLIFSYAQCFPSPLINVDNLRDNL